MRDILKVAHEMAQDLHEIGAMDDVTMRKMDVLCSFATAAHPSRQKGRGKGTRVKSNVCSVGYKPVPLWNDLYAFKTRVYTAILIYSPLRPSKDWPPKT